MKPVNLVEFKAEHARDVKLRACEGGLRAIGGEFWEKSLKQSEADGPCWSLFCGNEMIGCGGIRIYWDGVGEAWAIYPDSINQYLREILFYTRKALHESISGLGLWRVQATAREDFPGAQNFLEHLGFQVESILPKFGPDKMDCFLYSIVR